MKKQILLSISKLVVMGALLVIASKPNDAMATTRSCKDFFKHSSNAFSFKPAAESNSPSKTRRLNDFADPSQLINQVVRFENWGTDYLINDIQAEGNQFKIQARSSDSPAKTVELVIDEDTTIFPGAIRQKQVDENGKPRFMSNYLGQMVTLRISNERRAENTLQVVHAVQGQVVYQDDQRMQIRKSDGEVVSVDLAKPARLEVVEWRFWGPTQEHRED